MGFWLAFAGFVAAIAVGQEVVGRVSFRRDRARVWALAEEFTRAEAAAFDEVRRIVDGDWEDASNG